VFEGFFDDFTVHFRYGPGERDLLGADLDTVLSVATICNAPFFHEGLKALALVEFPRGVRIEKAYLGDGGRTDKMGHVVYLRTHFQTTAAGHTAGKCIARLLVLLRHARSRAKRISAVDRYPGLDLL